VATSSLELGIDMGAVDLVVQVESPASVASGLQRIGRAGHQVGEPSRGRIFPKFRGDLVSTAVVVNRMKAGLIEETRVPRNPVDVLAQQIVAMVAIEEDVSVDDVRMMARGAYPFVECGDDVLESVLDLLAGRYPSDEFAELRPRVVWDRIDGRLRPRPGARTLAITSGGTIPDRGLFGVFTPEGTRVGELDEEMVYESRVGETFLLGASTWRIEDITRDRVVVTPAPGEPGKMPFWHGDGLGRPVELGRAIGEFLREVGDWSDEKLADECNLDALAVQNLRSYLGEEIEATGALPTDRQIVVQRFRDEIGDWRMCVLSPWGARVHAPWALAVESRIRDRLELDVQAMWSDEGFVIRLPEAEDALPLDALLFEPDEVDDLVVDEVANSPLFAARFRENAARALLLPRRRPGQRTPLWQMRQRAADLLSVASRHGSFPILLETYRECLRDVFDLPALKTLMGDIRSRKIRVVAVDTERPSPFATSLAFAYIATFLYEGDAPIAERRVQALTLDRGLLAELLGAEELRELIDASALAALEAELQALDERRWARDVHEAADLLRRLGDLSREELRARSHADFADELLAQRRALAVRIAGDDRLIAIEDAGRYRDALGVGTPPGVPEAFLVPVDDPLSSLLGRWARVHGPFLSGEPAARFGVPVKMADEALHRRYEADLLLRGEFRPDGTEREWCDPEVLRLLRQRSLAALRREVEAVEPDALVRFLPAWQGVGSSGRGLDRLYEVVAQLQGVPIPASVLERDVLPARVDGYSPRLLDDLTAAGHVLWVGAGSLGRDDGKVALFLREQTGLLVPPPSVEPPSDDEHVRLREILSTRGACFFRELGGADDRLTLDALWDLVWAGEVTNDSFAPLRVIGAPARRASSKGRRPRPGSLTVLGPPRAQGRWSLVSSAVGAGASATERAHAQARVLLERHGVLTREAVRGEGVSGGFAGVYPVLRAMEESGRARRGYFVAGLGGAQFALPGAVDRLRSVRDSDESVLVLAATDPANPFGVAVPWPAVQDARPARAAGAYVVIVDGAASLYVERGGKGLLALRDIDGSWEERAIDALVGLVTDGRLRRLAVERVDPALAPRLQAHGFVPTPKGLVRYA
jgi:ATP-dependent Lhr-like helicase